MVAFSLVLALLTSLAIHKGSAFFSPCEYRRITPTSASLTTLQMAPKYDPLTNEWEPTKPDEEASSGYPPIGSLIRQGPVPFFQRMMNPSNYEQGVLKMMASESMSRNEAQGNMDAYLQNPNDWAVQKLEEKRGAAKFDYATANMDPGQLILTAVWASLLVIILARIVYIYTTGCDDSFCQEFRF